MSRDSCIPSFRTRGDLSAGAGIAAHGGGHPSWELLQPATGSVSLLLSVAVGTQITTYFTRVETGRWYQKGVEMVKVTPI